jgi:hypothetical protein
MTTHVGTDCVGSTIEVIVRRPGPSYLPDDVVVSPREVVLLATFLTVITCTAVACTDERGRVTPDTYPMIAPQDSEPTEPTEMYIDFAPTNAPVARRPLVKQFHKHARGMANCVPDRSRAAFAEVLTRPVGM